MDEQIFDVSSNDIWNQTVVAIRDVALSVLTNVTNYFKEAKIDPLPTTKNDVFKTLNVDNDTSDNDFKSIVKVFVEKGQIAFLGVSKTLHRKEGLERLLTKLQSCRKELDEMIRELEKGRGLSEDAAERWSLVVSRSLRTFYNPFMFFESVIPDFFLIYFRSFQSIIQLYQRTLKSFDAIWAHDQAFLSLGRFISFFDLS